MGNREDAAFAAALRDGDAVALMRLYRAAADDCGARGEAEAACFYLTHAYIWALDAGLPEATALHARLVALGREE